MSTLNALFNVLRGWPLDQSVIDQSFKPYGSYLPTEGDIVQLVNDNGVAKISPATATRYDDAASVAVLAQRLSLAPQLWVCTGTMQPGVGYDSKYVGKVNCLRGILSFRTERFNSSDTYLPGDAVAPIAGVLRVNPVAGTASHQKYGEVLKHNTVNTTLEVSILS